MNRFLIDTHVFLWFISDDPALSENHRETIVSEEFQIYISIVSFWECIVKAGLGKLTLRRPFLPTLTGYAEQHLLSILSFDSSDLAFLEHLPDIHRDPFDRLLICQAKNHDMVLLTDDRSIKQYDVRTA